MHSSWKGGGGPWGFIQILFRGVLGVVRKSRKGRGPLSPPPLFRVLLHFYVTIFGPYPPPPPVCIYDWGLDNQYWLKPRTS
jgi:hypothetical protein